MTSNARIAYSHMHVDNAMEVRHVRTIYCNNFSHSFHRMQKLTVTSPKIQLVKNCPHCCSAHFAVEMALLITEAELECIFM